MSKFPVEAKIPDPKESIGHVSWTNSSIHGTGPTTAWSHIHPAIMRIIDTEAPWPKLGILKEKIQKIKPMIASQTFYSVPAIFPQFEPIWSFILKFSHNALIVQWTPFGINVLKGRYFQCLDFWWLKMFLTKFKADQKPIVCALTPSSD